MHAVIPRRIEMEPITCPNLLPIALPVELSSHLGAGQMQVHAVLDTTLGNDDEDPYTIYEMACMIYISTNGIREIIICSEMDKSLFLN